MRVQAPLEFILVVLFCVMSGDLECGPSLTAQQRQGQALYGRMCVVCHGREGAGYAADEAPALSHSDFLASVSNEYLRKAIADGRRDTTMSAWSAARGGPLSMADVDAIVAFVRTWQDRPPATLDERPTSGDVARGGAIFSESAHAATVLEEPAGQRSTSGTQSFWRPRATVFSGTPSSEGDAVLPCRASNRSWARRA